MLLIVVVSVLVLLSLLFGILSWSSACVVGVVDCLNVFLYAVFIVTRRGNAGGNKLW